MRELDLALVESFEQHEQVQPHRLRESASISARGSMRRMTSTPPAPRARASITWYGSTRKSLRIAGTFTARSSRAADSRCASVAVEAFRLGEHRDGGRTRGGVARDARADVLRRRLQLADGGRAQLHFGDEIEAAARELGGGETGVLIRAQQHLLLRARALARCRARVRDCCPPSLEKIVRS